MKKKLTLISSKEIWDIKSIDNSEIELLCKPGTVFRILGDRDPWYIVGCVFDNVKNSNSCQVVYKSWGKYKQRWIYKTDDIFTFMYILGMKEELYKDNDGHFVIKEKKKK